MENFDALGLPQPLLHCLQKMQFTKPTPIQAQAIPAALEGRDILGSAQTGTGKTGAFGIPLVAHLLASKQSKALIMTPTRELAAQVVAALQKMTVDMPNMKTALLIGGDSMFKQLQQIKARPRIVVGTPGRINDHLQQGTLRLAETDYLVLDETDRMLDMGFEVQIEKILKHLPQKRQTLLFSATLPRYIVKLSEKYLRDPVRIAVGSTHTPVDRIKQELVHLAIADKFDNLIKQLDDRNGSVIVFVRTKRGADRLAKKLSTAKHSAEAIHGDLNQNKRTRVIQAFRDMKHRILVATDVAARGLDIPHIEHVINYDLPQQPEDYIHRIGRTGRAGAEGSAVCFITPEDRELWRDIQKLINPEEKGELDDRPSSGRKGGGGQRKSSGGKKFGGKPSFGKSSPRGGRRAEGRSSEGRSSEGRSHEGKSHEGRSHEGRSQEGRASEGRFAERRSEGRSFEKRSSDGKSGANPEKKRRYGKRMQQRSAKTAGR